MKYIKPSEEEEGTSFGYIIAFIVCVLCLLMLLVVKRLKKNCHSLK